MLDILASLAGELAKGFLGEAGKAGAKRLFAKRDEPEPVEYDPIADAEAVGTLFLHALAEQDHDTAWSLCDPEWPADPERNESLDSTFAAAPPASWAVQQRYVPGDWRPEYELPWVSLEVLVTFDLQDGTYSTLPGLLWMVSTADGWRVADINWDPDGLHAGAEHGHETSFEELFGRGDGGGIFVDFDPVENWVIACTRCPQQISVPVGGGRIRVKCPACWTTQVVDT